MRIDQDTRDYFEIGDRDDLTYEEKLASTGGSPTTTSRCDAYEEFCARHAPAPRRARASSTSRARSSTACSSTPCTSTFPEHEHEQFVAHYRGLLAAWAQDQRAAAA